MGDQGNNILDPPLTPSLPPSLSHPPSQWYVHTLIWKPTLIYIHDSIPVHTLVIKCPPGVPWDLHLCIIIKLANVLPNFDGGEE